MFDKWLSGKNKSWNPFTKFLAKNRGKPVEERVLGTSDIKNNKGKCIYCGRMTEEQNRFSDDADDYGGYLDFCHDDCYEALKDKL